MIQSSNAVHVQQRSTHWQKWRSRRTAKTLTASAAGDCGDFCASERLATSVSHPHPSSSQHLLAADEPGTAGRGANPLSRTTKRRIAMADPDPRHHADPMNPGLPAPTASLEHDEPDRGTD